MWRSRIFLFFIFFCVICCSQSTQIPLPEESSAELHDELLKADTEFASAAAARGIDGWMSFFAEDAVRMDLRGDIVRGLEAIRSSDSDLFSDPEVKLRWEPRDAVVFKDGRHGFTRGTYWLVKEGEQQQILSRGTYLSIWRLDDGKWKVILDTGSADPTLKSE